MVTKKHILRAQNQEANRLAQSASDYRQIQEVLNNEIVADDWRSEIMTILEIHRRKSLESSGISQSNMYCFMISYIIKQSMECCLNA